MPAIALQPLSVSLQDGAECAVLPGDDVPGYDSYPPAVREAMRSAGRVRDLERDVVHLSTEGGRLHFKAWAKPEVAEPAPIVPPIEASLPELEGHACTLCERAPFGTAAGLARHVTRMHGTSGPSGGNTARGG